MQPSIRHRLICLAAILVCAAGVATQTSSSQAVPASPGSTTRIPQHRKPRPTSVAVPPVPAPPPKPDWPIDSSPKPASVRWDSSGLRIDAANSSLQQILDEVESATGTKVEGFGQDQRVYGNFGPGQPRDILAQLLQGTGYNILMVGDQGKGVPREILLSAQSAGGGPQQIAPRSTPAPEESDEDSTDNQMDVQPPPPQPAQPGPRMQNGNTPRTPQQVQQEMLERQQQILRMQQMQQQQANPQ